MSVDDIPAAQPFTYQTATLSGVTPEVAASVNARLAELTEPDVDAWRDFGPEDCAVMELDMPCGQWEQTATVVPCIEPYACLLIYAGGVIPGGPMSVTDVATFAVDPLTGREPALGDVVGPSSVRDLLVLANDRLSAVQSQDWQMGCSDFQYAWTEPLTKDAVTHWLPTADGVQIWFDEYQVVPGAAGNVTITVPWSDLEDPAVAQNVVNPCAQPEFEEAPSPGDAQEYAITVLCGNDADALPDVVPGSAGADATRIVQTLLTMLGYAPGPIDGQFGPVTQAAVQQFQANLGLVVDAEVGPQTWSALQDQLCSG